MKEPSKPSRLVVRLALSLIGTLVCLGALEVAARWIATAKNQSRIMMLDDELGWKLIPGARKIHRTEEEPYEIVVNAEGLRDRDHELVRHPPKDRILVLGDSFVFGSGGVAYGERFTEVIEGLDPELEVLNFGVPAYSPDQEFLLLNSRGLRYQPRLVVLGLFVNDFREAFVAFNDSIGRPKGFVRSGTNGLRFEPPKFSLWLGLAQHSYLLGWLDVQLQITARTASPASKAVQVAPDEQRAVFRQLMLEMRNLCRRHNAGFLVVYFPFRDQSLPNEIQNILAELSRTEGIEFLDFMEVFRARGKTRDMYFGRDVHLNSRGHQIVARVLLDHVRRMALQGLTH